MTTGIPFWKEETSVLLTGYWYWRPETWGAVNWTGDPGRGRRDKLLRELSNPFITVCYITQNKDHANLDLIGMIAGFYLVSHETGDRNEFTHPAHHKQEPERWRHALKANRAFSYLPEYRLCARDFYPRLKNAGMNIAAMGEIIKDAEKIKVLQETPWVEVEIYRPPAPEESSHLPVLPQAGMVRPGPDNKGGYLVSERTGGLPRELYILHLVGNIDAYLRQASDGRKIIKIGFSVSPKNRRDTFQKSMPEGAFKWQVYKTTTMDGHSRYDGYFQAEAGEYAMKKYLATEAKWLGGEFYLATDDQINTAWKAGREAAVRAKGGAE